MGRLAKEGLVDESSQIQGDAGAEQHADAVLGPPMHPASFGTPGVNAPRLNAPGLGTPNLNAPGLGTTGTNKTGTPAPSHELQPLGQRSSTRELDAATWAGQSLVVALVLGGVAMIAYGIKRRQIQRQQRAGAMFDRRGSGLREPDESDAFDAGPAAAEVSPRSVHGATGGMEMIGSMGMGGMGATDAMRDEIAALRAEIESARDEAVELRREVAALRAMVERGVQRDERGSQREDRGSQREDRSSRVVPPLYAGASEQLREPQPEPKPTRDGRDGHNGRDGIEQRVLALAARGESTISIAQRTGVPTGQVELMLNLARASGRA